MERRTRAEINLDALAHNMREIRRITNPNAKILATVKADAYGHGAVECVNELLKNGADRFSVATLDEAVELRRVFPDIEIQLLGSSMESDAQTIIENNIIPNAYTFEFAKTLSDIALKLNKSVKIHIKIDTGMSRIGYVVNDGDNQDVIDEILAISKLPMVEIEGIFSHFSTSDEADTSYTDLQFKRFMYVCDELKDKGLYIPIKHICNSAGIMMYPEYHLDMVRPGIILYGMYPSNDVDKSVIDLKYVMTLKSTITYVKEIEQGRGVSYGKKYIADGAVRIATVPIGYADGYSRLLSEKAKIQVGNNVFPVVGRICMDQCMIDVSGVNNINRGDEALIFGDGKVTADDIAQWMGTINYEITCMVSRRIPREYKKNGKTVKVLDYLL